MWPEFLNCSLCIGFWIGFLARLFSSPISIYTIDRAAIPAVMQGAVVSVVSFIVYQVIVILDTLWVKLTK